MKFGLTTDQQKQLKDWHNDCEADAGAIGGRVSYTFTPTGLGMCIKAQCMCGEEIDLTDVADW